MGSCATQSLTHLFSYRGLKTGELPTLIRKKASQKANEGSLLCVGVGTVVQSCLDAEAEDSKQKRVGRKSRKRCAPIQ